MVDTPPSREAMGRVGSVARAHGLEVFALLGTLDWIRSLTEKERAELSGLDRELAAALYG